MSLRICLFNLPIFLTSFFSRIVSVINVMANRITRMDIKGSTSINHLRLSQHPFSAASLEEPGKRRV